VEKVNKRIHTHIKKEKRKNVIQGAIKPFSP
jgi:hypothetical protein